MEQLGLRPWSFGYAYMVVALGFVVGARLNARWGGLPLGARISRGLIPGAVGGVLLAGLTLAGFREGTVSVVVVVGCAFLFYVSLGLAQMVVGAIASFLVGRLHSRTEIGMAVVFVGSSLLGMMLVRFLPNKARRQPEN